MKSLSLSKMTADKGSLSRLGRLSWLLLNFVDNTKDFFLYCLGFYPSTNLDVREFRVLPSRQPDSFASPTRIHCDYFWNYVLVDRIEVMPSGKISILEYGCGSGRYGQYFRSILGSALKSYIGVDIQSSDRWSSLVDEALYSFYVDSSSNLSKYMDSSDLFVTQSALEHFPDDLSFVETLHGRPDVTSIHLVPSTACLYSYLWHGYRQYSIVRLANMFAPVCSQVTIFRLGGPATTLIQFTDRLLPQVIRLLFPRFALFPFYRIRLFLSLRFDHFLSMRNLNFAPSFYAVIARS